MSRVRVFAAVAAFVIIGLVAWVPVASAALEGQIFLDPTGALFSGCAAPCPIASIDITLINGGADANVTFTALSKSGISYLLGGVGGAGAVQGSIVMLDILGPVTAAGVPNVTIGNIVPTFAVSQPGVTNPSVIGVVSALDNVDGIGSYNLFLAWADGAHGSNELLSSLSFTIHNNTGVWGCVKETGPTGCGLTALIDNDENIKTSWTNMLTGVSPFTSPSWAGVHVSKCATSGITGNQDTSSCQNPPGGSVVTAFAGGAATTGEQVPEPGTLALLGTGLLLVGGAAARRFRK